MSAKEMFEELGMYLTTKNENGKLVMIYSNKGGTVNVKITPYFNWVEIYSENGFALNVSYLVIDAIKQQITELGWEDR